MGGGDREEGPGLLRAYSGDCSSALCWEGTGQTEDHRYLHLHSH